MINSLINQKYFLSQKLQKEIFAIICTKKINTITIGGPKGAMYIKQALDW